MLGWAGMYGRTDSQTEGQTDGWTDKAATICSPFGEHNKTDFCGIISHIYRSNITRKTVWIWITVTN